MTWFGQLLRVGEKLVERIGAIQERVADQSTSLGLESLVLDREGVRERPLCGEARLDVLPLNHRQCASLAQARACPSASPISSKTRSASRASASACHAERGVDVRAWSR